MLFLFSDILNKGRKLRIPDRKRTVSALPCKGRVAFSLLLNPLGGVTFDVTNEITLVICPTLAQCEMHVISHTTHAITLPTTVTRRPDLLKAFHAEHGDVIFKPLDGMGGSSIFRLKKDDPNVSVIIETLTDHGKQQIMAQRFIPEITSGDKRILMIDGEAVPFTLARIPADGETRGNLAAGGSGITMPLSAKEKAIADQIGPILKEKGLYFVGLDVIGDYITEINVTSPTCVREISRDSGIDVASQLIDCLLQKVRC